MVSLILILARCRTNYFQTRCQFDSLFLQRGAPVVASSYAGCRQVIGEAFTRIGVPVESLNILISSLSKSSLRQYDCGLKTWWLFCAVKKFDPFNCSEKEVLLFLTEEFERGASYSSLNCYRSAIS